MEEIESYKLAKNQVDAIEMLLLKAINSLRHNPDITMEQQEAFAVFYNDILLALNR